MTERAVEGAGVKQGSCAHAGGELHKAKQGAAHKAKQGAALALRLELLGI